ncbi:MAG: hypothetical protein H7Y86_08340 [Rhizobacter sp.]|nr:hypothetical protein [Ferruginibacter sp.]
MGIFKRNYCCFFFCCLLSGRLLAQPQKLYLNPATAGPAAQSNFIEITRFIPIDAATEKISTNTSLFITKNYWVAYDYIEKKLSFFTKQGKFIKFIAMKKYGEPVIVYDSKAELLKFNIKNKNYTLTNNDLVAIRAHYAKKANQKYFKNYEINLKEESLQIKRTTTDPYFIINARPFYDDYYYRSDMSIQPRAKDTSGYELQLLEDHKPVKSFFPFNRTGNHIFRYANAQMYLSDTDTAYIKYTSRPFSPVIYKMNKNSISPVYEIVLPLENAMPSSRFINGFKSKADWDNFQNSNGAIFFSFNSIRDMGRHLFFGIRFLRNYESFLYDKNTAKFYKSKMIKADSSQYNIQLLQNGLGQYADSHYYALIPAQSFLDFYEKNKEKKIVYPPELERFFKTATKNSNPVMVEYKIKD